MQPDVVFRGKADRYCFTAYGHTLDKGFATKEEAQHFIGEPALQQAISDYRAIYMEEKRREAAQAAGRKKG